MSRAPSRDELVEHVVRTRIAGDVATPREGNLANIHKMLARAPDYWFGLELDNPWSFDDVLKELTARVGIDGDAGRTSGPDRIDPDRCVDALDDAADRLAAVAARRGRVILATGHPTGILALHMPVAATLAAAGCEVLTTGEGRWVRVQDEHRRVRYVGGVATIGTGGDLLHTHAPEPMHMVLEAGPPPDLVVADHGWAGAAAQAGIPTIGFADSNDPALFVGAAEGKVDVAVPLDDNVTPAAYAPLAAYLVRHIRDPAAPPAGRHAPPGGAGPFGLGGFAPPAS